MRRLCLAIILLVIIAGGAAAQASTGNGAAAMTCSQLSAPAVSAPADGATYHTSSSIVLDWDSVPYAANYRVQIDDSSDFSSPLRDQVTASTEYSFLGSALGIGTYYWRVQAAPPDCPYGAASAARAFVVCGPPTAPSLLSPDDGASVVGTGLLLDWSDAPGANHYLVQWSFDSQFTLPLGSVWQTSSSYTLDMPSNSQVYWRVRVYNGCGEWGPWSTSRSFRPCKPAVPSLLSPEANAQLTSSAPVILRCGSVDLATMYAFEVVSASNPGGPSWSGGGTNPEGTMPAGMLPEGHYLWRARADNSFCASGDWSSYRDLYLCDVPAAPTLTLPANDAETWDHFVMWRELAGATLYQAQVASDNSFATLLVDTVTNYDYVAQPVWPGTAGTFHYYWRVRARNGCGWGPWSETWHYVVVIPPAPTLLTPPSGATFTTAEAIALNWTFNAHYDTLQVDNDPDFASPQIDQWSCNPPYTLAAGTLDPGTYYWRANTRNQGSITDRDYGSPVSPWSATRQFTVCATLTAPPLQLPEPDAQPTQDYLKWGAVTGATHYQVQVDSSDAFSTTILDTLTTGTTYALPAWPTNSGTYHRYWRVRAQNACGWGPWTTARHYYFVVPAVPTLVSPLDDAAVAQAGLALNWNPVAEASKYQLRVWDADTADWSSPTISVTVTEPRYVLAAEPQLPYHCRWSVSAIAGRATSAPAPARSFRICTRRPVGLLAPANLAYVVPNTSILLDWDDLADVLGVYHVQVDDDPAFGSPQIDAAVDVSMGQPSQHTIPGNALPLGTYYWRVSPATAHCISGPWSDVRRFTISSATPTPTATCTPKPTPSPTPAPGDLNLSGTVSGGNPAGNGTDVHPLAGARVAAVLCVPGAFEATTDAAGHYALYVPGAVANACTNLTLVVKAPGYVTRLQTFAISALRTQPQRDWILWPGRSVWLPILQKP